MVYRKKDNGNIVKVINAFEIITFEGHGYRIPDWVKNAIEEGAIVINDDTITLSSKGTKYIVHKNDIIVNDENNMISFESNVFETLFEELNKL